MIKTSRTVASPRVVNIEDLRPLARRRLPKAVFDYLDGGAEAEVTLRENCRAFEDVTFRPRHAVAVPDCDLRTRVLGFDISFPALLAPVGYSRLIHPDGEAGAARAAGAAGTAYILSTISGHRVEDVKAASSGPVCFQLYMLGGRDASEAVIERARVAGCSALVVTIDTPVAGLRERDYRNGMKELLSGSLWDKMPFLPHVLARPAWIARFWLDGVPASLRALPEVVAAVQGQIEVLMDGGIRRGTDIVKALCLGARAVLCGRAYAYGLAAAGEAGVARALDILRADVERTLKLLGCRSVSKLDRSYVDVPASWGGSR